MASMYVKLEWDGNNLGPRWMNIDNLRSLLYSTTNVKQETLSVKEINPQDWVVDSELWAE